MNEETTEEMEMTEKEHTHKVTSMSMCLSVSEDDSSGKFSPIALLVLEVSEKDKEKSVFGGSSTDDIGYIILDEGLSLVSDKKVLSYLYSGLDSIHSSKKVKIIDEITAEMSSEKHKLATVELLTKSIGKIPKDQINIVTDVKELTDTEKEAIKQEFKKINSIIGAASAGVGGKSSANTYDIIDRYAFKKHLMFVGEAGQGKTHSLSGWIHSKQEEGELQYIIADFHEAFEASEMLGMMIPNDAGTLTWIDGPVTQAFRSAAAGHKTVLFCDEILRSPQRELSLLVGALTPKADGMFTLRTNRVEAIVDGIGQTEEIKCSPENLWVVAASNVGAGFAVDDIDTAFKDRFRTFRIAGGSELARAVAANRCKDRGFSDKVASKMAELFDKFQELKGTGNLQQTFSVRHISEVLTVAETQDDIFQMLDDLSYTCLSINSNGIVNSYESEIWEALCEPFRV